MLLNALHTARLIDILISLLPTSDEQVAAVLVSAALLVLPDSPAEDASLTGAGAGASVCQLLCCEAGLSRQLQLCVRPLCQGHVMSG